MSHTTAINAIKIVSVPALRRAVESLARTANVCLKENAAPRAYFPDQQGMGVADLVVELKDSPYDVGLYKQPDGSYEPRTDLDGGHVARILGVPCTELGNPQKAAQSALGKLFQAYAVEAACLAAREKGLDVRRSINETGAVVLTLTGSSL